MADEPEDAEAAAARLEAALERIARLAAVRSAFDAEEAALSAPELAARLDALIGRLRAALDKPD